MEKMYYRWCGRLQQDIEKERDSAETFGQNRVERAVQQNVSHEPPPLCI